MNHSQRIETVGDLLDVLAHYSRETALRVHETGDEMIHPISGVLSAQIIDTQTEGWARAEVFDYKVAPDLQKQAILISFSSRAF